MSLHNSSTTSAGFGRRSGALKRLTSSGPLAGPGYVFAPAGMSIQFKASSGSATGSNLTALRPGRVVRLDEGNG